MVQATSIICSAYRLTAGKIRPKIFYRLPYLCIVNPNNRMLLASLATGCNRIYCIDLGEGVRASDFLQLLKVVSRVVSSAASTVMTVLWWFLSTLATFFGLEQSLTGITSTLDLKPTNSWHRSAYYHPFMPTILDSCSFHFLSLLSKWKWNSCRLYKPILWQIPNFMHAMASCIVRGFFRHAVKTFKAKTQRGRERNKGLWCGARTKTPDAVHALLYLF